MNNKHKTSASRFIFSWILPIGIAFILGLTFQMQGILPWNAQYRAEQKSSQKIKSALEQIKQHYVEDVSIETLTQAAIRGMTEKLDRHSTYLPPQEFKAFKTDVSGNYAGLGMRVEKDQKTNYLRIVTPFRNSPADRNGLKPGDLIISVEGASTADMTLQETVSVMKGKEGTSVTITVRSGEKERTVTLKRAKIKIPTVPRWGTLPVNGKKIGYIVIRQFSDSTDEDFKQALTRLKERGIDGLLLDLRMNRGGLLDVCVNMTDYFLSEGKEIVTIKQRGYEDSVKRATSEQLWSDKPVGILVNGSSASASEVFSGALQDHGIAFLVGTRTYGKGSVQKTFLFPGKTDAIKLTIAKYYTPNGRSIDRSNFEPPEEGEKAEYGLEPDYPVEIAEKEENIQEELNKLVDSWHRGEASTADEQKDLKVYRDRQIKKALEVLKKKLTR